MMPHCPNHTAKPIGKGYRVTIVSGACLHIENPVLKAGQRRWFHHCKLLCAVQYPSRAVIEERR